MKETGDLGMLASRCPTTTEPPGTLYEHMRRALDYSWGATGWHGLPKIGNADWNDCLNLKGPNGNAVSVMIAEMFVMAADLMADIAGRMGRAAEKAEIERRVSRYERPGQCQCMGRAVVRCAPSTTTARPSAPRQPRKAGSGWSHRCGPSCRARRMPCAPGPAWTAWRRILPPARESSSLAPAYATYHPELGYVSVFPQGPEGERCHLLPHQPVGNDRRDDARPGRRSLRLLQGNPSARRVMRPRNAAARSRTCMRR